MFETDSKQYQRAKSKIFSTLVEIQMHAKLPKISVKCDMLNYNSIIYKLL